MPHENVEEKIKEIIVAKLDQKTEDLKLETRFQEDLGADSLDAAEIVMEIEEKFDIQIPEDSANKMKTIGDAVTYVKNLP